MTNKFRFMLLSMAALGIVSCSDKLTDESGGTDGLESNEGKVYMNVAVALPSASSMRSGTDEDGETNSNENPDYEVGHDFENDIKSIVLVLASEDGKYIAHNLIESKTNGETTTTKKYIAKASFSRTDITQAYSGPLAESRKVNVYAFCNNPDLDEYFNSLDANDTDWLDKATKIGETDAPVFFMSNSSVRKVEFPETAAEWGLYNTEERPFELTKNGNAVYVERAAARFDYKKADNSEIDDKSNKNVTTYNYGLPEGNELGKIVNVALAKMSLVNMSSEYYNLRRVSGDGKGKTDSNNFEVSGTETPSNYVVDTDWEHKSTDFHTKNITALTEEFNFPLFSGNVTRNGNAMYNEDSKWYTETIYDVLNKQKENDEDKDTWKDSSYKIWRYVTENTIPADNSNQIAAHSTGIVFKAAIVADDKINEVENLSEKLKNALNASKAGMKASVGGQTGEDYYDYPTLYLYNNQLYAGIDELVMAAAKSSESVLYTLVNRVLSNWYLKEDANIFEYGEDPDDIPEGATRLTPEICNAILNGVKLDDSEIDYSNDYHVNFEAEYDITLDARNMLNNLLVGQNFTIYKADNDTDLGGGYFCYYFYWNRHNDNGEATVMGPMEFGIVRNNVYKLTVSTISQLGHPTNPDDDPDPVKPDDPDEEDKVYMSVNVEVLPWVVRVNDIEF